MTGLSSGLEQLSQRTNYRRTILLHQLPSLLSFLFPPKPFHLSPRPPTMHFATFFSIGIPLLGILSQEAAASAVLHTAQHPILENINEDPSTTVDTPSRPTTVVWSSTQTWTTSAQLTDTPVTPTFTFDPSTTSSSSISSSPISSSSSSSSSSTSTSSTTSISTPTPPPLPSCHIQIHTSFSTIPNVTLPQAQAQPQPQPPLVSTPFPPLPPLSFSFTARDNSTAPFSTFNSSSSTSTSSSTSRSGFYAFYPNTLIHIPGTSIAPIRPDVGLELRDRPRRGMHAFPFPLSTSLPSASSPSPYLYQHPSIHPRASPNTADAGGVVQISSKDSGEDADVNPSCFKFADPKSWGFEFRVDGVPVVDTWMTDTSALAHCTFGEWEDEHILDGDGDGEEGEVVEVVSRREVECWYPCEGSWGGV
ncbi:hypothetical protein K491DRAFT_759437 [Lophiostoma macrostomum CBS 122681]|uniref:Uncharacterized protein n=1 Tax=Lophiostoma macrostomum CBS 122681 TaxID=1314788 RepID=A0A6A6T256_9PLEO|nr:hypothetical protein K491DRAFT_759437 [Lophiostoma macrostomum CBS 122681]